jgi:hypothetical protein
VNDQERAALARKNLRTGLLVGAVALLSFLLFVSRIIQTI